MALRMVSLVRHPKTGAWKSRKVIPDDVREAYGKANEVPTWSATLTPSQAKAAWSSWLAEVEAKIDRLRQISRAKPIGLTHRAALLSGRNHHRIGWGMVTEGLSDLPGYNGAWPKSAASVAEVLKQNGYNTSAFGKWHNTRYEEISPIGPFDRWPTGRGFEYYYGFMRGEASQWEPPLYENTTSLAPPARPDQGYHFTTDIVDRAIGWVHTQQALAPEKPYFLYLATGATHDPVHVP